MNDLITGTQSVHSKPELQQFQIVRLVCGAPARCIRTKLRQFSPNINNSQYRPFPLYFQYFDPVSLSNLNEQYRTISTSKTHQDWYYFGTHLNKAYLQRCAHVGLELLFNQLKTQFKKHLKYPKQNTKNGGIDGQLSNTQRTNIERVKSKTRIQWREVTRSGSNKYNFNLFMD